jgi:hypothetical protein
MGDIQFITIETDLHGNKEKRLFESAAINGIEIIMLGKGAKWNGFTTRPKMLKKYLESINTETICVTDARDVLYMSDAESIYQTYIKQFGKHTLVFNGDTACFPNSANESLHPKENEKYRFLNAGCIIGNRILMIDIISDALEYYNQNPNITDDQELYQHIFLSGKYGDDFTIDYNCQIFQPIWDENGGRSNNFDLAYTEDGIWNRLTRTKPLIIHHAGPTSIGDQSYKVLTGNYIKHTTHNFF